MPRESACPLKGLVSGELSAAAHPEMVAVGLQFPVWSLKAALAREQKRPPVTRGSAGVGGSTPRDHNDPKWRLSDWVAG